MSSPLRFWLGGLLLMLAGPALRADVGVGDAFPVLSDQGLTGGELPAIRGKVAVVDFWASWCAPCRASFASFSRLHEELAAQGLVIVAVSVDEKAEAYHRFLKQHRPAFATLLDQTHKLVASVNVPAMPSSYVLDRQGRVRFVHRGFQGKDTEQELRRQIVALLAEKE